MRNTNKRNKVHVLVASLQYNLYIDISRVQVNNKQSHIFKHFSTFKIYWTTARFYSAAVRGTFNIA